MDQIETLSESSSQFFHLKPLRVNIESMEKLAERRLNSKVLSSWALAVVLGLGTLDLKVPTSYPPILTREAGFLSFLRDIFKIRRDVRDKDIIVVEDDGTGPPKDGHDYVYVAPTPTPVPEPINPESGVTRGVAEVQSGKKTRDETFRRLLRGWQSKASGGRSGCRSFRAKQDRR